MFGRNMIARHAAVTRTSSASAWVTVAATTVALAAMCAPRVHVLAGLRGARSAFRAFLGTPTTIADETVSVPLASSRGVPIWLPFPGDLQLDVSAIEDARVNVHVIRAVDWNPFQKAEGRLLSGRFRFDFPEFQALSTAQARLSGRLLEGPYIIVIENPTLAPSTAPPYDVYLRASLRP
jgi:hypothetical protein